VIVFTLYVAEISILNVPCTRRRLATVISVEKSSPGNSRRSWSSKCIITHCVGAESGHVISWHLSLSNLLVDTFRGLRRLSRWWLLMSDIILWCVRHFVHLPFAAISRSWCGAGLHLEDHSGGMGGSTGVRLSSHLDQAERRSRFSKLRFLFVDGDCTSLDLSDFLFCKCLVDLRTMLVTRRGVCLVFTVDNGKERFA